MSHAELQRRRARIEAVGAELGERGFEAPTVRSVLWQRRTPWTPERAAQAWRDLPARTDAIGTVRVGAGSLDALVAQLAWLGPSVAHLTFGHVRWSGLDDIASTLPARIDAVREALPLTPDAILTVVLTVDDTSPALLSALHQRGVQRVELTIPATTTDDRSITAAITAIRRAGLGAPDLLFRPSSQTNSTERSPPDLALRLTRLMQQHRPDRAMLRVLDSQDPTILQEQRLVVPQLARAALTLGYTLSGSVPGTLTLTRRPVRSAALTFIRRALTEACTATGFEAMAARLSVARDLPLPPEGASEVPVHRLGIGTGSSCHLFGRALLRKGGGDDGGWEGVDLTPSDEAAMWLGEHLRHHQSVDLSDVQALFGASLASLVPEALGAWAQLGLSRTDDRTLHMLPTTTIRRATDLLWLADDALLDKALPGGALVQPVGRAPLPTDPTPARLGEADQAAYRDVGFVKGVAVLTPAEVAHYRSWLEDIEVELAARQGGVWTDREDHPDRHVSHPLRAWAHELAMHPRLLDAVASVLGDDLLVRNIDIFVREPGVNDGVVWHRDSAIDDPGTDRLLTAWLALSPATPESGCLRFVAGSHQSRLPGEQITPHALSFPDDVVRHIDQDRAIDDVLAPGEASLHHIRMVHASGGNRTAERRIGLAVRFAAADASLLTLGSTVSVLARGRIRTKGVVERPAVTVGWRT